MDASRAGGLTQPRINFFGHLFTYATYGKNINIYINLRILQPAGQKVETHPHQAAAYVAPKKAPLTESNSNSLDTDTVDNGGGVTNGNNASSNNMADKPVAAPIVKKVAPSSTARPRWGGAEICPRCNKSVSGEWWEREKKDIQS